MPSSYHCSTKASSDCVEIYLPSQSFNVHTGSLRGDRILYLIAVVQGTHIIRCQLR